MTFISPSYGLIVRKTLWYLSAPAATVWAMASVGSRLSWLAPVVSADDVLCMSRLPAESPVNTSRVPASGAVSRLTRHSPQVWSQKYPATATLIGVTPMGAPVTVVGMMMTETYALRWRPTVVVPEVSGFLISS